MISLFIVIFALAVATSAHAMSPAPLNQPDSMVTQVREACGAGFHMVNGTCVRTAARQVCGWDAHTGWPLRQMKCQKAKSCKQANLRFEQPKEV